MILLLGTVQNRQIYRDRKAVCGGRGECGKRLPVRVVSFWGEEHVLELHSADGSKTLWVFKCPWVVDFKMVNYI